ncbi:hypothetical protein H6776_02815 [Candidatus Nomurabacteria bacterium]|nr:hypothetical protein [Candidatus Nomurabacteria bacterium]
MALPRGSSFIIGIYSWDYKLMSGLATALFIIISILAIVSLIRILSFLFTRKNDHWKKIIPSIFFFILALLFQVSTLRSWRFITTVCDPNSTIKFGQNMVMDFYGIGFGCVDPMQTITILEVEPY